MQKEQPLVSVIMPVYNAEKYLAEAIESVVNQRYQKWELLIIDDGSEDRSLAIVESYAEKDDRIQLYINDSGEHGPGVARNYGMEKIRGKYTYFIDADDWIEKELLWDTVDLAEKTGADIVPFGFVIEDNGKKTIKKLRPCGIFEFQHLKKISNEIIRGTWSECHEIIRSDLLKNVRHNSYKTGEDICFQMDLLCNVRKICGIDKEYYHYRIVHNSISHADKWDGELMESNIAVWNKEKQFLEYCGLSETSQLVKNAAIERYTGCIYCLIESRCSLSLKEKYNQIKNVANKMNIKQFKRGFDCKCYSGIRKIVKLLVKYNLEMVLLLLGTLFFRIPRKIRGRT